MTVPVEQTNDALAYTPDLGREVLLGTAGYAGSHYRILQYVLTSVPLGNTLRETARDIAAALGVTEGTVSKGVKKLSAEGWLATAYSIGVVNFYMAGPKVFELAEKKAQEEDQPLATVSHLPVRHADVDEG
ncbi:MULTISPECIES: MarR family transcriptional regulator [Streptomyces]|uniref:MarR family transcriptional regulator n=1 Tax=Streptomyces TaxID=1883 RepID=UPI002259B882|nr:MULTISPECIES: helix-turn-helix domain-containing protein [Streptomyces]MCX5278008.1 MarR family transcriptional regulator [Streptomyces virginiae]